MEFHARSHPRAKASTCTASLGLEPTLRRPAAGADWGIVDDDQKDRQALSCTRSEILGVHCDQLDSEGIINWILRSLARGRGGWVVTPNVDILRQAKADPELARLVSEATLAIVDGAPVEWAGRIAKRPMMGRTSGASLVQPLAEAAAQHGVPILLLGGRPGSAEAAASELGRAVEGASPSHLCPPLGFESDETRFGEVVQAVRRCEGGIVFCGFGFPKQERLMARLTHMFPGTWFLGVGGAIDFLAGAVPRAPLLVQRLGFEWLFRLLVEPRRLARRYLVDGMPFALRLMTWALRERIKGSGNSIVRWEPAADRIDDSQTGGRVVDLRSRSEERKLRADSLGTESAQGTLEARSNRMRA